MTQPPPSGPWGSQQPGQQPGQWPQGQGYPGGPGQFGPPQQPWPAPVPPKKGGAAKWIIGAVALVAVIAVTAVVAVSCTKSGSNNGGSGAGTAAAPNKSGIASANDTGPVSVITEDPSCAPWGPVVTTLSNVAKNGWDDRDPSIPATAWTTEQQSQYHAFAQALRSAADQIVPLTKLTTHRIIRELYEQFIAYAHAYADSISTYTAADNQLNLVTTAVTSVVNGICGAISYGSAAARGPLVAAAPAPSHVAQPSDPTNPSRFMPTAVTQCSDWKSTVAQFNADPAYALWSKGDSNIPASSWTDEDKAQNQAVVPVLNAFADAYDKLAGQSPDAFMADLAVLAAQYGRAFVASIPTYSQADIQLYNVFAKAPSIVKSACAAVGVN